MHSVQSIRRFFASRSAPPRGSDGRLKYPSVSHGISCASRSTCQNAVCSQTSLARDDVCGHESPIATGARLTNSLLNKRDVSTCQCCLAWSQRSSLVILLPERERITMTNVTQATVIFKSFFLVAPLRPGSAESGANAHTRTERLIWFEVRLRCSTVGDSICAYYGTAVSVGRRSRRHDGIVTRAAGTIWQFPATRRCRRTGMGVERRPLLRLAGE